ncbi:HEAT repeat-containing protein 4 isoform X2 [Salminus brasiliensis]|uniref:HEAT repeat-containing protein 4 isoform X2 n=1 Tax=Salminus brasiliensis TaxID=930266 RepID=UPI003B83454D
MDLQQRSKGSMEQYHSRRRKQIYTQFLQNASEGLSFSQDVMWEMGADGISYSKADFSWLFQVSGSLAPGTRLKIRKKAGTKALPWHTDPKAKEKKRDLAVLPPLETIHCNSLTSRDSFMIPGHKVGILDSFKRTGFKRASTVCSYLKEDQEELGRNNKWDEDVLKKLSKTTAQWIVSQQIPRECHCKAGLQSLLKDQYGSASATDLVTDEPMCEEDFSGFYDAPKPSTEPQSLHRSKSETQLPLHYRDEKIGFNQTATAVTVKQMEPPKPPRLQDCLNPRAGKYVYHTHNDFEQELYSGIAKQVHQQKRRNFDRITMDNNSEYQKNLQELFPCGPEKWTHSPGVGMLGATEGLCSGHFLTRWKCIYIEFHIFSPSAEMGRVEKGARRWVDLPTNADYALELGLRPPDHSGQEPRTHQQQVRYNPLPELSSLRYAVVEWRNAWKLNSAWKSVTVEGLKKALTDLHYHVRVAAIAICALRAVNRSQKKLDGITTAQYGQGLEEAPVPPDLQPILLSTLSDPVKRVQMAAAVCQYAMGTPNASAREILQNALHQDSSGTGADSWVAAQCLAVEGEASRTVVERLLTQLFLSKAPSDRDQAATLLASISTKTTLVRSRLAEELNCANWRTRVMACNTISRLKCPTNKDLVNKLMHLMWNDWSGVVRQAAAQALGKLDMGSGVHDELIVKLEEGPTSWRVGALALLGQLKIMTAKMLPAFLRCMNDDFVVVRKQACLTAASLMLKDEMIMDQLTELMQNDTSCDVKVAAINGKIGCLTPMLEELLLWALHHEEDPQVRIAACEAVRILGVKGPALQHLLQERFILEPNPQVHRHIVKLIESYGYSLEGDEGIVHRITEQVQELCSKNIIIEKVLLLEELAQLQQHQKKLQRKERRSAASVMSSTATEKYLRCKNP